MSRGKSRGTSGMWCHLTGILLESHWNLFGIAESHQNLRNLRNLWNLIVLSRITSESLESFQNLWNLARILRILLESYENPRHLIEIFGNLPECSEAVRVFTKISDVFCSNIAYNCLTTSTLESKTESKTSLKSSSLRYA